MSYWSIFHLCLMKMLISKLNGGTTVVSSFEELLSACSEHTARAVDYGEGGKGRKRIIADSARKIPS